MSKPVKGLDPWKYSLSDAIYEMFKEDETKTWNSTEVVEHMEKNVNFFFSIFFNFFLKYIPEYLANYLNNLYDFDKTRLSHGHLVRPMRNLYKQVKTKKNLNLNLKKSKVRTVFMPPTEEIKYNADNWTQNKKGK